MHGGGEEERKREREKEREGPVYLLWGALTSAHHKITLDSPECLFKYLNVLFLFFIYMDLIQFMNS